MTKTTLVLLHAWGNQRYIHRFYRFLFFFFSISFFVLLSFLNPFPDSNVFNQPLWKTLGGKEKMMSIICVHNCFPMFVSCDKLAFLKKK